MSLHERIREARKQLKASQEAFAAQLGVSRGAVAQWEMPAGTAPTVDNLAKIASLSGVAFEWLVTGRGQKIHGHPAEVDERRSNEAVTPADLLDQAVCAAVSRLTQAEKKALLKLLTRSGSDPGRQPGQRLTNRAGTR